MKIIAWASGLIFTLCLVAFVTVMWLAAGEDICLDRKPWWGPPESGSSPDCSGHMWEQHEAGYGWFGGPK